jgi:hypothetical protein
MRAYLAITGTIFALLALLHIYRMFAEWNGFGSDFWTVVVTTLLALGLSYWAWRLFTGLARQE